MNIVKPNLSEMTDEAMAFTEQVTTRWAARIVGSPACLACGDYLLSSFASFCDATRLHEFKVRPGAFLGFIKINVVLYFLALIALWAGMLGLASLLASISIFITIFQFFFYRDVVNFLFPQKIGKNVVGFIEPLGEVKQQIIVSAHHDSAHVFNFLAKDPASYPRKVIIPNVASFGLAISASVLWIGQLLGFQPIMATYILAGIFTLLAYWVGNLWFFYRKEGTPGAGDNMVCTALAMEVGKYFSRQKEAGNGLQHTRVVVASWDAEEAGLRGARAYIKAYGSELLAVKTYNFNLECMYEHEELAFLTSDLNSFVPLSMEMVDECIAVGEQLGYSIQKAPFPFLAGGTDAAEFAKAGIEATTLAAMNWKTLGNEIAYHTLRDTIAAVDAQAVSKSIAIGIQYIQNKDQEVS